MMTEHLAQVILSNNSVKNAKKREQRLTARDSHNISAKHIDATKTVCVLTK